MEVIPTPGTVIASRFRVENELGRGGMGVVLRGRDETNRPVAIKVLLPEAVEHPEAVPRFMNEARAARELTSEHSVRILDAGTLDTGLPYMVMELLEGDDLATQLEQRGKFTVPDACDAIIDACDALAEAHARGMVHRDLKPANLFAAKGADGRVRVKVLDFGVSKVAAQVRQIALTSTGTALGTPYYMAPEQLKSAKGVDARADVWSIGVVLYELLTGRVPFDGKSFGHLFMQIVSEEPKAINELRSDLPPEMVEIVKKCMKKDREHRYADLAELVQALAVLASPSGQAAAKRIAEAKRDGSPVGDRESSPMLPVVPAAKPVPEKIKGTMVMANAPNAIAAARQAAAQAAAAQKNGGTAAMPQASMQPQQAQQPQGDGSTLTIPQQSPLAGASFVPSPQGSVVPTPQGSHVPAPPQHESGRWSSPSSPNPYPPINAATPPGQIVVPQALQQASAARTSTAPPPSGGLSKGLVFGIVAGLVGLMLIGVALIAMSRH